MVTNCTLCGFALLFLGYEQNGLLKGSICFAVPKEVRHDLMVRHAPYKVVKNDVLTEIISMDAGRFFAFCFIIAEGCLPP